MTATDPDGPIVQPETPAPTVWIPRPWEDAQALASELETYGIQSLIAPVLTISIRDADVPLDGVGAMLFTSANGVRAFAKQNARRNLTVYAVGENTAAEARTAGFGDVHVAGGDVDKLADYIIWHRKPEDGTLLHVAASERAGDLAGLLEEGGFAVDRRVLYDAEPAENLPGNVAEALDAGAVDAVVLFSPRTARIVCDLLAKAGRRDAAPALSALCLSANVAEVAKTLDWREIVIADAPDRGSLLQAVRQALHTGVTQTADKPDTTAQEAAIGRFDREGPDTVTPLPGETMNDTTDATPVETMPNAETVIERFGGIRPMAQKLGVTPSTIQGWKARNHVPENRWDEIRAVAEREGVSLESDSDSRSGTGQVSMQPDGSDGADGKAADETPVTAEKAESEMAETKEAGKKAEEKADGGAASNVKEQEAPTPPPVAVAAPPRRPSGLAWIALIVALGSAAGVATQSYWRPSVESSLNAHLSQFFGPPPAQTPAPPDPVLAQTVDALKGRVGALENRPVAETVAAGEPVDIEGALAPLSDRLAALEDAMATAPATSADQVDLSPLNAAVDALRSRVNAMDTRADDSLDAFRAELSTFADQFDAIRSGIETVTDRVAAVERRLAQIESNYGGPSGSEAALVLTVGQLDSLMAASEPFGGTLQDIAALAPDDDAVQKAVASLAPLKDAIIASRADIIDAFDDVAPAVDRAERVAGAEGWVDETLAEMRGLISIRRTDSSESAPAVSRAEAALEQGDLAGAVAAVEPLAGEDPAIAGWVTQAKQRITASEALMALRGAALARLRMAATGG